MTKKRRLEVYWICKELATMELHRVMRVQPFNNLKEWHFHLGYLNDKVYTEGIHKMTKEDYKIREMFFELLYHSTLNPQFRILI